MKWAQIYPWSLAVVTFVIGFFWGELRGLEKTRTDNEKKEIRSTGRQRGTGYASGLIRREGRVLHPANFSEEERRAIMNDLVAMEHSSVNYDDDIRIMDIAELLLNTPKEELPALFEATFKGSKWDSEAASMIIRQWAKYDPHAALRAIDKWVTPHRWAQSHSDHLKAIVCYELADTAPQEAAQLHNKLCKRTSVGIGSGPSSPAPDRISMNIYQRISQRDTELALRLAMTSEDVYESLHGCVLGAVQSGQTSQIIQFMKSLDQDGDHWGDVMHDLIRIWPHYESNEARAWFDQLDAETKEEWQEDFEDSLKKLGES